ncbi:MAG: hypothetical protein NT917_05155 [Microcystis aeruginosa WS75]|nr:hypothetical protein [Microcystis aeruginosa WS75]
MLRSLIAFPGKRSRIADRRNSGSDQSGDNNVADFMAFPPKTKGSGKL